MLFELAPGRATRGRRRCAAACASTPATSAGCSPGWRAAGSSRASARRPTAADRSRSSPRPGAAAYALLDRRSAEQTGARARPARRRRAAPARRRARRRAAAAGPPSRRGARRPARPARRRPRLDRRSGTASCTREEYGWNAAFEALVARIVADFAEQHDPAREAAWIAEVDGAPAGCVFCVPPGRRGRQAAAAARRAAGARPRARGAARRRVRRLRPRRRLPRAGAVDQRRARACPPRSTSAPASGSSTASRTTRSATIWSARRGRSTCRTL